MERGTARTRVVLIVPIASFNPSQVGYKLSIHPRRRRGGLHGGSSLVP